MSKHTLTHASQILAGDGVAFNLNDPDFGMGDELGNTLRGIRIGVMVTEAIQGGDDDARYNRARLSRSGATMGCSFPKDCSLMASARR